MRSRSSAALAEVPFDLPRATHADLEQLRRRLARPASHDAVEIDFLEDDLRQAEVALGAVTEWLGAVEQALRDPRARRRDLLALATQAGPSEPVEALVAGAAAIQRRLCQVAARLPADPLT